MKDEAFTSPHEGAYSIGEEIANSVTHGVGALLGVAALVVLVVFAAMRSDAYSIVSYAIFGASIVILYSMSSIYHALRAPRAKKVFEVLDHSSIYVLIAGSYTAFALGVLRGPMGWWIFGIAWGIAAVGIPLKAVFMSKFPKLSLAIYILMGWLIVPAIGPMRAAMTPAAFALLVGGGLCYTVGAVFYALKKVRWAHPIWHLFVMAGTTCHAFSALLALP